VCEVPCSFIIDGTGGHIVGDVGVYLGDLEVYRKDPGMRQASWWQLRLVGSSLDYLLAA
jgi:hypothetical protein